MLLLSREDIKKVFSIQEAVEADKKAFTLVADGKCDSPLRTKILAPKYDGCFLFMPAYAGNRTHRQAIGSGTGLNPVVGGPT